MEKDPICGMEVDPENCEFQVFEGGKTYYFCSEHCLNEFQRREHPLELKDSVRKKLGITKETVRKDNKGMIEIAAPDEDSEDKDAPAENEKSADREEAPEKEKPSKENTGEEKKTDKGKTGEEKKKGMDKKADQRKPDATEDEPDTAKKVDAPPTEDIPEKDDKKKKPEVRKKQDDQPQDKDKETAEDTEASKSTKPAKAEPVTETIIIEGMHCASCVLTIEKAIKKIDGVNRADVNFATEQATVRYDPEKTDTAAVHKAIFDAGYKVVKEKTKPIDYSLLKQRDERDLSKLKVIFALIIATPLLYLGMGTHIGLPVFMGTKTLAAVEMILALAIMIIGYNFYTSGIWTIIRTRKANMDTLVAVGTTAAFMYSLAVSVMIWKGDMLFGAGNLYYEVSGVLVAVILLGRYLERATKGRVSEAVHRLVELQPNEAFVERDGEEYRVKIEELKKGDIVIVEPGGRIPVDGIVLSGTSTVDESIVTGEPLPVDIKKGSKVTSGTINKTGTFKFKATKVGSETFLAQITKLVQEAQGSKAPIQRMADRVASYFVPAVIGIAIVSFIVWLILSRQVGFPLLVFVAVLIIACPCALGLATPTAVMMGIGMAAQRGILIKNAEALQSMQDIDTIIFDKTGTLTAGRPQMTNYLGIGKFPKDAVLQYAAIVERRSEHPIATAIVSEAEKLKMSLPEPAQFKAHPGGGVEGRHNNKRILFGNLAFVKKHKVALAEAQDKIEYYEKQGKTVMVLAVEGKVAGVVAVADTINESAVAAVQELTAAGKKVILMTGDNKKTAATIAKQAGIDTVMAEVLPEDKERKVQELQAKGAKVAMVGDGINDAPALSAADLGIAVGSGTDIAIESAEVILVRNDLKDIMTAFKLSTYTLKKIKQNLFWALVYNSVGIPLAAGVLYPFTGWLLNPMIAGVAMALSSVSVVTNSLMMKRYKV